MITIEVNGVEYSNFIDVEVGMSLCAMVRDFSMTVTNPANTPMPFRGGESVKIHVEGELVLNGWIFEVSPQYSKSSHDIILTGRSKAADLVDSSLQTMTIAAGSTLTQVIEKVIQQLGLDIKVVNQVGGLKPFTQPEDIIGAEPGDNAFEFIDKLARKRQVLLTSDANGNIVIVRNGTTVNPSTLINRIGGKDGNIINSSISYNMNDRFNKYVVMSQLNSAASIFGGDFDFSGSVNQKGEQLDSSIRKGRQMVEQSEKAYSNGDAKSRAIWNANIAKTRSRNYTVILQGFSLGGGAIWQPNFLQKVVDEQAGINDTLLIDSVRFRQDKRSGSFTQLALVDKDAYTVSLSETIPIKKKVNQFAQFHT